LLREACSRHSSLFIRYAGKAGTALLVGIASDA
jgi:hypothetical protein